MNNYPVKLVVMTWMTTKGRAVMARSTIKKIFDNKSNIRYNV